MNNKAFFLFVGVASIALFLGVFLLRGESFDEQHSRILKELSSAIDDAVLQGKYKCCIDPPCTMCYLGNWIWEDGSCRCDDMIAKGEFDKVCPQCKKGIEEGECTSTESTVCDV